MSIVLKPIDHKADTLFDILTTEVTGEETLEQFTARRGAIAKDIDAYIKECRGANKPLQTSMFIEIVAKNTNSLEEALLTALYVGRGIEQMTNNNPMAELARMMGQSRG